VVLGAWASNNKYSFFGGLRSAAQMISYEIPLGVSILVIVATVGEVRLEEITLSQTGYWFGGAIPQWNIFLHPVAFVILFVTALAEANRTPFDLVEAEQEMVGGFHTEYNAMKFGLFFLGEYAFMITSSAMIAVLFFGGWHLPWLPWAQPEATGLVAVLVKIGVMCAKVTFSLFLMMWLRWTLPRFRFDQLMRLAWKGLIPLTLGLFVLAITLLHLGLERTWWALLGNVVVVIIAVVCSAGSKRKISGRQRNLPAIDASATRMAKATEAST